jgi:ABC-type nitrate/sulfonate/bicarbonate transport system permease component
MFSLSEKVRAREILLDGRQFTYLSALIPIAVLLILWQLVGIFGGHNLYAVPLSSTLRAFPAWWRSGMPADLATSGEEVLLGGLVAFISGLIVGILLGRIQIVDRLAGPWVRALYAVPVIALTPLFVIALGLGITSKVAVIAMVGFFPIAINTSVGTQQVSSTYLDVARAYSAPTMKRVIRIDIPAAMPYIITGVRLAVAPMIVTVFVAEMLGGTSGVGVHIQGAAQGLQVASMYAGILVLIVAAVLADAIMRIVEHSLLARRGIS